MKTDIYRMLDSETREWWAHKRLRDAGKHQKARELERSSLKMDLDALRNGYLCVYGKGGMTIHCFHDNNHTSRLQGYSSERGVFLAARYVMPTVDLRTMDHDYLIRFVIRGPLSSHPSMADDKGDSFEKYGPLDRIDYRLWVAEAKRLGATVYNA